MKKLCVAAAFLLALGTMAQAAPPDGGAHQARRPATTKQTTGTRPTGRNVGVRPTGRQVAPSRYSYPRDRYGYAGRHNDRYPADRYYWSHSHGRHYHRYYLRSHRWVICFDGARYPAHPAACISNGGILYFY